MNEATDDPTQGREITRENRSDLREGLKRRLKVVQDYFRWDRTQLAEAMLLHKSTLTNIYRTGSLKADALAALRINHNVNIDWLLTGRGVPIVSQHSAGRRAGNGMADVGVMGGYRDSDEERVVVDGSAAGSRG